MKQGLFVLLISAFLFFGINASAAFSVPTPTGFVTDTTGKLSAEQKSSLETKLHGFETSSSNEIAVLIVPSLEGLSIEDATQEVFDTWKVGKAGLDNGVLFVLAIGDRKDRIQTGKGVEGDLTDLQSRRILDSLKPLLRNGDFAGAVNSAVDQINSTLDTRKGQKVDPGRGATFNAPLPDTSSVHTNSGCQMVPDGIDWGVGWVAIIMFGVLGISLLARRFFQSKRKEELPQIEKEYPCTSCGGTHKHSHSPTVTYVPTPVIIPVAPIAPEPPPRRYTPRYDLYDAAGVPSISPDFKPSEAVAVVALSDQSAPSYVDDILPSSNIITSGSAYGGGESGDGGASSTFDPPDSTPSVPDLISDFGSLFGGGTSSDNQNSGSSGDW